MTQTGQKANYSIAGQRGFLCAPALHSSHLQHDIICLLMVFICEFCRVRTLLCIYTVSVFQWEPLGVSILCVRINMRKLKASFSQTCEYLYTKKVYSYRVSFTYLAFNKVKSELQSCAFPYQVGYTEIPCKKGCFK